MLAHSPIETTKRQDVFESAIVVEPQTAGSDGGVYLSGHGIR